MAHTPTSHRKPRKRSLWLAIASVFFFVNSFNRHISILQQSFKARNKNKNERL
ncbi:TPA: hypothetical protein U7H44_000628 [Streptococcus agalactiae]|nr:hypothetical protein [Streptococcus agalactiae]